SQNHLEYDFEVAPGADPSAITLEYPDATGLSIGADGQLLIHQAGAPDMVKSAPVMYQTDHGLQVAVHGEWVVKGPHEAGYVVTAYDPKLQLVIDPILFSTVLGGSGNESIFAGASDSAGNFYVAGGTTSTDFPVQNPFQSSASGSQDIFITKINAAG